MTRTWGRALGLGTFSLLVVIRSCSQSDTAEKHIVSRQNTEMHFLAERASADRTGQRRCAEQVVANMARRDGLEAYIQNQEVQLEPRNRIRVFFQFRQEMRSVLPRLGRFVKFPRWLRGRYASTYGRGQPGFELHLDRGDQSRTVGLDAHKSSDVDDHEPAGDLGSVVLHATNVIQHKLGQPERPPCELLAKFQDDWRNLPRPIELGRSAEWRFYVDENLPAVQGASLEGAR
ncbi:MAG: hypothetical protein HY233_04830 [Acidobacteriales bacterium]|nr:hypothetical protein [Candidatus Koribacter versatilis]MBI3645270.1 hypothetical protein [Terriglobales bacterium]